MSADTEQRKLAAIMFTDMGGLKLMPFLDHCAFQKLCEQKQP